MQAPLRPLTLPTPDLWTATTTEPHAQKKNASTDQCHAHLMVAYGEVQKQWWFWYTPTQAEDNSLWPLSSQLKREVVEATRIPWLGEPHN